jgi:Leucine-rich repeat (LRR) protein
MNDAALLAIIAQAEREGWTELDLSGKDLEGLPSEIGRLQSLEKLILGKQGKGNRLTAIPQEIFQLTNLKELHIPYNQITAIPDAIANFKSNLCGIRKMATLENYQKSRKCVSGSCVSMQPMLGLAISSIGVQNSAAMPQC